MRFKSWSDKGIWQYLFEKIQDFPDMETVMIDATIIRTHELSSILNLLNSLSISLWIRSTCHAVFYKGIGYSVHCVKEIDNRVKYFVLLPQYLLVVVSEYVDFL